MSISCKQFFHQLLQSLLFSYALMVLSNPNLKSLWKPKKLTVGYGNILLHGNMKLCPDEINSFNKTLNSSARNIGALTQAQNGFLCPGNGFHG